MAARVWRRLSALLIAVHVLWAQAQTFWQAPHGGSFLVPEPPPVPPYARALLEEVNRRIVNIDSEQLHALLVNRPHTVVIDVRTPAELNLLGGHIDHAYFHNITRGWLEFQVEDLIPDKNTPIVVYCGVNQRSPLAADTLQRMGYREVYNLADGYFKWRAQGYPVRLPDRDLTSFLYARPQQVIPGVWSAIGATAPGTYDNSGHNNNLSFIVTDAGVIVVNAGDSWLLAASLHDEIKRITDRPVKYVVLENGQGHAMLGMSYWQAQGAKVIAHRDAAAYIEKNGHEILDNARRRLRDKAFRTELSKPDIVYEDRLDLSMGGWRIEVLHLGNAHHHGDTMVWLPDKKLVISGDTAFHVRMLPVFEDTDTARWLRIWDEFEKLGADIVIPGHGGPTDMATVRRWTRDYLRDLRARVAEVLARGGSLDDAYKIDQSDYMHLHTSEELARLNAGRVFRAMEFE
ncbi:MAG: rhodanese-like domain-containing protein [Thiobacillaceae bacterium]|nr:rhodanese-like domain-containing protein [Thiobacillaceae bacterium]